MTLSPIQGNLNCIHCSERTSPWSPFCLRVEEEPSWTGRTIDPISYTGKPLTLFTIQREPVPGLLSVREWRRDPAGQGEPLTLSPIQGNLSLFRENQSLVSFLSESGGGVQRDRENHRPYLLYRETFNFIHCSERTSLWSPFCLRVEEGPSWTGRTIDHIS